jgi:hypothetical protein
MGFHANIWLRFVVYVLVELVDAPLTKSSSSHYDWFDPMYEFVKDVQIMTNPE